MIGHPIYILDEQYKKITSVTQPPFIQVTICWYAMSYLHIIQLKTVGQNCQFSGTNLVSVFDHSALKWTHSGSFILKS